MKYRIYLMLLGFSIFTGATFNVAKYALQYFSVLGTAAWRFGIAALAMAIILILKEKINAEVLKENLWIYIVLGVIGVFGFNSLFFLGMRDTSPINGSLIMSTNPLVTTLLAWIILKDSISKRQGIGVILALLGVSLVITKGSWEVIHTLSISKGDIYILFGNICWALYGILGKRFLKNSTSFQTTSYTMIVGAISLICVAFLTPDSAPLNNVTLGAWSAIAFMALGTSVLGYLWWNRGIAEIGAGKTSLFFNLVPIVTMIISLMSGVPISLFQVIGVVLVLAGVLTASGFFQVSRRNEKIPLTCNE